MPKIHRSRKSRFKAACARVGITQVDWAKQEGVSYTHLYLTLGDPKQSLKLSAKIDAFIEQVETQTKELVA
jgi:hypothetical protein